MLTFIIFYDCYISLIVFVINYLQILSTRARKNVALSEIKVDVCIYAFDLLYLNGQQLLQEQLCTRRQVSKKNNT